LERAGAGVDALSRRSRGALKVPEPGLPPDATHRVARCLYESTGGRAMSVTTTSQAPADATALRQFMIEVPEAELEDLRARVAATRWADRETVADHSQGVPLATIQALAQYWATDYDWRRCEARLNTLPHFLTEIDGLDIHFIHVRSQHEDALPLIITHGWPGSVIEQLKIIDPLTNPTADGASASDAFHLVIPSMPGYSRNRSARGGNGAASRRPAAVRPHRGRATRLRTAAGRVQAEGLRHRDGNAPADSVRIGRFPARSGHLDARPRRRQRAGVLARHRGRTGLRRDHSRGSHRQHHPLLNELDAGGHFAAWEQPKALSEEIRAAFRSLR
jgi:hypothetical protein